jgi:hypothetical protein
MKAMPADTMRALAEEARERYARELFDINRVSKAIAEAAAGGLDVLHIRQDKSVTLQSTRAAAKLQQWLLDGGYQVRWTDVPLKGKDGLFAVYGELVIGWEGTFNPIAKG